MRSSFAALRRSFFGLTLVAWGVALSGCGSSSSLVSPLSDTTGAQPTTLLQLAPRAFDDLVLVRDDDPNPITIDLLANDTEHGAVTVGPAVAAQTTGSAGGQATISSDGKLVYTPPAGSAPYSETFTYTVSNAKGTSTAAIKVARKPTLYVNKNAGGSQNGTKKNPFTSLAQAINQANGQPVLIVLSGADYTSEAQSMPVITLQPGQAITGDVPKSGTYEVPSVGCRFVVPTYDCSISNLSVVGNSASTEPMLMASGNTINLGTLPNLVISNTTFFGNGEPGIELHQPTTTEITTVRIAYSGQSAIVVKDPIGAVKMSSLSVDHCPGVLQFVTTLLPPIIGNPTIPVEVDGLLATAVPNPFSLNSTAGKVALILNNLNLPDQAVTGTLLAGEISGASQVDATITNFNLSQLGLGAAALQWNYRDQSTGTFKIGNVDNVFNPSESRSNSLRFYTYGQATASYVSSNTHLSAHTPLFLLAQDGSLLKDRIENYGWSQAGVSSPARNEVRIASIDSAQTFSAVSDLIPSTGSIHAFFFWQTGFDAGARIEQLNDLAFDNPDATFQFFGYTVHGDPDLNDNPQDVVIGGSKNFSDADPGSLGIPTF